MGKIKVGIVGASGYAGEELVRLISRHPEAELSCVCSRSLAGSLVADVMPHLRELVPAGLKFTQADPAALRAEPVDVWFLSLPHGVAAEYARPLVDAGRRVFDLSADFRLNSPEIYEEYYGKPHPDVALLREAPYVIPELAQDATWKSARLIACPGCYPTSILLPLVPLLRAGLLKPAPGACVINSYSGVSGAGKKADLAYAYCERDESVKAYGIPRHRHLSEIEEQLSLAAGTNIVVQFCPHLAPMKRGIHTTIVVPCGSSHLLEATYACWEKTFDGAPFVAVLPAKGFPDTAHVVGTNRADLSAIYDARTGNIVITSCIDNLLKGAAGQAVQLMNLALGFDECAGLL
ncbi:MAG: N-acetyl-gamma-glutamyl-phosphate reductase [Opitutae bacterium]|nr:N-acetyl-gamma-glutamyl-phosphate reductase [Opitutae bacterium]